MRRRACHVLDACAAEMARLPGQAVEEHGTEGLVTAIQQESCVLEPGRDPVAEDVRPPHHRVPGSVMTDPVADQGAGMAARRLAAIGTEVTQPAEGMHLLDPGRRCAHRLPQRPVGGDDIVSGEGEPPLEQGIAAQGLAGIGISRIEIQRIGNPATEGQAIERAAEIGGLEAGNEGTGACPRSRRLPVAPPRHRTATACLMSESAAHRPSSASRRSLMLAA